MKNRAFPLLRLGRVLAPAAALLLALPQAAWADLLSGGFLGTLLRGDAFTGPRLVDLGVLGLVVYVAFRLLAGRSQKADEPRSPTQPAVPRPQSRPLDISEDDPPRPASPGKPGKPDMYSTAQATWDYLKSRDAPSQGTATAQPASGPAGGSPQEEFLAGAKLAYGRILDGMTSRDFTDLAQFTTPDFLAQLKNRLPEAPAGRLEILLVDASLVGEREERGRTVMEVEYKALVREPGATQNSERRERWRFSRDAADGKANWLLEGMDRL